MAELNKVRAEVKKRVKGDQKRNAMLFDLASTFMENALPIRTAQRLTPKSR